MGLREGQNLNDEMISVGIDIGTSTMQLIFSKLVVENLAGSYSVPRISIVDKRIIYESEIAFTPMISDSLVDIEKCRKFIDEQYKIAGVDYNDVKTGAVIITGESARKENADKVLENVSCFAGNFVVATAGPSLESMLSGLGANIGNVSKSKNISIVNVDIGGGTSNISFFNKGKLCGVTCLDIGGRLIKVDVENNKITYVYHKIKKLAEENGIHFEEGEEIDIEKLEHISEIMVQCLAESLNLIHPNTEHKYMFTNDEKELNKDIKPDGISFSGGVGDLYYISGNFKKQDFVTKGSNEDYGFYIKEELFKYGDIGIILAQKLRKSEYFRDVEIIRPKETIRATVIGAGMYTTELSGSTIFVEDSELPLKNIPILKIKDSEIENADKIIKEQLPMYFINDTVQSVALAFEGYEDVSFEGIQKLSEKIITGAGEIIKSNCPLVVVVENDIGKALGNSIISRLRGYKKVICIDGIVTLNGDYMDIGRTVADGQAVPVIVKTLIFNW